MTADAAATTVYPEKVVCVLATLLSRIGRKEIPSFLEQWDLFDKITIENHTDFVWQTVLDELENLKLLEYELRRHKHENSEWAYKSIDGQAVSYNPFTIASIDFVTGEGGKTRMFEQICDLYDKTFGGNTREKLRGKLEECSIDYDPVVANKFAPSEPPSEDPVVISVPQVEPSILSNVLGYMFGQ